MTQIARAGEEGGQVGWGRVLDPLQPERGNRVVERDSGGWRWPCAPCWMVGGLLAVGVLAAAPLRDPESLSAQGKPQLLRKPYPSRLGQKSQ